ncbi:tetratricopeptide repeat protein [Aestuariivirga litoralis]|uniref:tetratricopeptide repeat protein n=1 Tax=Aestuariivirga litoralis TaxID=2650924 RepID=UPI0018C7129E|nr:tetratricopeptide repeat protein [Aestuariivirga litoralis]MBG1233315.1 tetratricopeptide repeat protein [Aestuariivirga litoralis]
MRLLTAFCLMLVLTSTARAEDVDAQASASTTLNAAPEKPEVTRQRQLDALLGKLHTAPANADVSKTEDEIWQIWVRNDSPTAEVLLRQSSAAISAGDYDPAEQMLSQALETYPKYAEAWNRRAALYYLIKRYDAALIDADHALALEPRNFGALIGKGLILQAQKKHDEAKAAFEEALQINPHLDAVAAMLKQIERDRPNI